MQPESPYVTPPPAPHVPQPQPQAPTPQPTMSDQTSPDYSFIAQQPKKATRLPSLQGKPFAMKALVILVVGVFLVIVLVTIKSLIATSPFNKSDYLLVAERQQEMLHIMSVDVTSTTLAQLTPANQNFVATSVLSLKTAESKTLTLMTSYKDSVSSSALAKVYATSVDQQFTSSLSSNSFNSFFNTEMSQQLGYYEQELKSAYTSTNVVNARSLIRAEYSEALLLSNALNSPTS